MLIAVVGINATARPEKQADLETKQLLIEAVQPDYVKWESVKVGMTEEELKNLLGKPLANAGDSPGLIFGRIKFASPSMPDSFDFYVLIHEGKVLETGHPFGGDLSTNGKPTTPVLIYPQDRSKFDHFPRFVDLRWYPSSGKYPMRYAVEVESGNYKVDGNGRRAVVYNNEVEITSELPYAAFAFGGKNPGRWRVKAKNALGESNWSEWRLFQFEQ